MTFVVIPAHAIHRKWFQLLLSVNKNELIGKHQGFYVMGPSLRCVLFQVFQRQLDLVRGWIPAVDVAVEAEDLFARVRDPAVAGVFESFFSPVPG